MLKVLIVDDEENARLGLSKLLSSEGYLVAAAADGFEALHYLKREPVDLVITDINMPGMSGLVFLHELRTLYPQLNVIMLTAYGGVDSYLDAMNRGASEYLNKPVRLEDLKAVISRFFVHQDRQATSAGSATTVS